MVSLGALNRPYRHLRIRIDLYLYLFSFSLPKNGFTLIYSLNEHNFRRAAAREARSEREPPSQASALQGHERGRLSRKSSRVADQLSPVAARGPANLDRLRRIVNQSDSWPSNGQGPTDAWSRVGARRVLQVRVALLNEEWRELAQRQFPWIGQRCVTWPWQKTSQAF